MSPVDVSLLRRYRSAIFDNRRWERFEYRPGDIFVCTLPKCGTTWMQTIVASLLWPDGNVSGQVMTLSPWIDANFFPVDEILARLEAQAHRRFIKTHTPADGIPWRSCELHRGRARRSRRLHVALQPLRALQGHCA
jgi:hypothetical protein